MAGTQRAAGPDAKIGAPPEAGPAASGWMYNGPVYGKCLHIVKPSSAADLSTTRPDPAKISGKNPYEPKFLHLRPLTAL